MYLSACCFITSKVLSLITCSIRQASCVAVSSSMPIAINILDTAPSSLNGGVAVGGLIAVLAFVAIIITLINKTNRKMKSEYALEVN